MHSRNLQYRNWCITEKADCSRRKVNSPLFVLWTACDRYIDSSFVLQGFDGVSEEQIWELNKSFLRPDLNIILLADPEILQKRLQKRESLSAFEKRMTREEEIYMYRKAIDFLSRKNIPHIIYMNNTYDELQKTLKMQPLEFMK